MTELKLKLLKPAYDSARDVADVNHFINDDENDVDIVELPLKLYVENKHDALLAIPIVFLGTFGNGKKYVYSVSFHQIIDAFVTGVDEKFELAELMVDIITGCSSVLKGIEDLREEYINKEKVANGDNSNSDSVDTGSERSIEPVAGDKEGSDRDNQAVGRREERASVNQKVAYKDVANVLGREHCDYMMSVVSSTNTAFSSDPTGVHFTALAVTHAYRTAFSHGFKHGIEYLGLAVED